MEREQAAPSNEVGREELHHRRIDMRFFKRSDGLYEVEGRLIDKKTQPFRRMLHTEDTPPGQPLHDICVRLVVDEDLVVHDATASIDASPFDICGGAVNTLAPLQGLRIGAGWNKRVRELLGGVRSCTHIKELLGPMATTAYQGIAPQRLTRLIDSDTEAQAAKVDSCYAYAAHREVVATLWPHLHKPRE
jgi:hypothetical protein